ncbi:MAG TPA: hypothetical protein K8V90_05025 [Romboutsia timonensis]|uniref:Uncharacterized protein n=1 Tax=Romboutsia timonensis TaxID=1776391 RepID=A0A921SZD1_9FIRM|nr:hypothetical protein [Romboutsia timonensis]
MAKRKRSLNLSKTELIFEDDKVIAIEHLKNEDKEYDVFDLLRDFEGCQNLTINISTEKEI